MKRISVFLCICLSATIHSAVIPENSLRFYLLQTATRSAKVVSSTSFNESVIQDVNFSNWQHFEFIPVAGKADTYFLKNGAGHYLTNSFDLTYLTEYDTTPVSGYGEWILEGSSLNSVKLKSSTSAYLGTENFNSGTYLICDRTSSDVSSTFSLVPVNSMIQQNLIDPGFENAVVEGAPLGVWINNNSKLLGNDNPTTQNYRSRVVNNGFQSSGNNAFIARFYGDENSYTKISYKISNLIPGATYRFSFKYKQANTNSADAFVNTFVTLNPNDLPANAISNIFVSTPPASITTSQTPGTGSISFFALASESYIVWEKNPNAAAGRNFLFYLDDLVLEKVSDPVTLILEDIYYIQQRSSGKVIGKRSDNTAGLKYADANANSQKFRFVAVPGKPNEFSIINGDNEFLGLPAASGSFAEFSATDRQTRWIVQGASDTLVYIRRADDQSHVLATDSVFENSLIGTVKSISDAGNTFILHKVSEVLSSKHMFDPDFENCPLDGGPLGTWVPNNDPLQFGSYGFSRIQGYNGWASTGKKTFYLRFMGDASSYNSISQKLFNLVPGATYRLDLQYKCQSTSATSLVNIYAATTPNAAKAASVGGFYSTTTVAASNLATQQAQSTSLTFVAPASSVWIVYAKNTTTTNFNFFPDNLRLTETIPSAVNRIEGNLNFKALLKDNQLNVNFEDTEAVPLHLYVTDISGRTLLQSRFMPESGEKSKEFGLNLSSGIYLVRLVQGGYSTTQKIQK